MICYESLTKYYGHSISLIIKKLPKYNNCTNKHVESRHQLHMNSSLYTHTHTHTHIYIVTLIVTLSNVTQLNIF